MFTKILIANRGEIACRVIETAQRMGIRTVAIFSDADKNARHVRMADEAYHIGGAAAADSYLKAGAIIDVVKKTGAQAVHPGYGFLSENTKFAKLCEKEGIKFIGPSAKSIDAMGLKDKAKELMEKAGVPVVPGYQGENQDEKLLHKRANEIGYPVLIKAVAGGGGKGMRLVEKDADFLEMLHACKREAKASFDNDVVLIEKYITKPRHVEVQVFGDAHGNAVHLFERDCSLQRRHQKVVEEAPAPDLPQKVRNALGDAAVKAVKALGYENAGTIEFIMDSETFDFYFMEMNTRLQVEHPVTEMITGFDLVEWQLRIAAGETIPAVQDEIKCDGHAFEVRLYAEDAGAGFLPQTGTIAALDVPENVRFDTAVEEGDDISIHYDPMIAKLIVHGKTRDVAAAKMQNALRDSVIAGVKHNQEFLRNIFAQKDFLSGDVDTGFIARHEGDLLPESYGQPDEDDFKIIAYFLSYDHDANKGPWDGDNWRMSGDFSRSIEIVFNDKRYQLTYGGNAQICEDAHVVQKGKTILLSRNGRTLEFRLPDYDAEIAEGANDGRILAPMPGKIIDIMTKKGQKVEKDQPLLIMEAMKMEMTIRAVKGGVIEDLPIAVNDQVSDGALLIAIKSEEA